MEDPRLRQGEKIIMNGLAGLISTLPIQGRFILTSQRLIYLPSRSRLSLKVVPVDRIDIELSEIESTGQRPWARGLYGGFPGVPLFTVALRDGTNYTFQVIGPRYWLRKIERLRHELAEAQA